MIPTTEVLTHRLDALLHDLDRWEFLAHQRGETSCGFYATRAHHYTICAITLGLRRPDIGPPFSSESFDWIVS